MTPEIKLIMNKAEKEDERLYVLLMELGGKVDRLVEDVASFEETRQMILNHIRGEETILEEFKAAFPGGDPKGHRIYHEEVISQVKAKKEFWNKLAFELAKYGLIAFVGWMVIQLWHGALQGPVK
jgi:hemerythrin